MNSRVLQAEPDSPHSLTSENLDIVARCGAEPAENSREIAYIGQDTMLVHSTKRRLGETTVSDPLPTKRARLMTCYPGKATVWQPKPNPPMHLRSSLLQNPVAPVAPVAPATYPTTSGASVSKWLESIKVKQEKDSLTESQIYDPNRELDDRDLTKSQLEMKYAKEKDAAAAPELPTPSVTDQTTGTGVLNREYRAENLASNKIFIRFDGEIPSAIDAFVKAISQTAQDSIELSMKQKDNAVDEVRLLANECDEDDVAEFLGRTVFPRPPRDSVYRLGSGLLSSSGASMSPRHVPVSPDFPFKITQPRPDKLYGYSGTAGTAFTKLQKKTLICLHPTIANFFRVTKSGIHFPFLAVELKAAAGTKGNIWVAENQCAGAAAACLNAMKQLNELYAKAQQMQQTQQPKQSGKPEQSEQSEQSELSEQPEQAEQAQPTKQKGRKKKKGQTQEAQEAQEAQGAQEAQKTQKTQKYKQIDNFCYCVAADNRIAYVYVSWLDEDSNYQMQLIDQFILLKPDQFGKFHGTIRNILHWGMNTRLEQIRGALDLVEALQA